MKKILQSEVAQHLAQSHLANNFPFNLSDIDLSKDLLTDKDVLKLFGISERTLSNHKKKGLISYFKMGSKTMYLKPILMMDILKIYND
ncbi:helix-turn-helix domain-containing protein [Epilithonimonas arachidiradicis]|uniref:Helix-turn-helix protein n=1 Tax=Epilithonimonas arachidiradicis TaxID=1617282 RepID=A0A420CMI4_9FLAO|nr:helix-turn-helix domain-containing protein [Epilithonimonas arachidiradicis]RKE79565.1 hypothetical protein BXY58_3217 [Epilithonimonas arachidiradicis]